MAAASLSSNQHDAYNFRVKCTCKDCLIYRESIIQLFYEDCEYNNLWTRLQLLIRKFYDIVPKYVYIIDNFLLRILVK